ncbi:hypothetical protein BH24ACI3_BH24ACI3_02950 [soil metagenome]
MMEKDQLRQLLFPDRTLVYAALDGASIPELRTKLYEMNPPHHCLFRGTLEPDMQEVAPYVAGLQPGSDFVEWLLDESFGKHWGIFIHSRRSLKEMRLHLRKLLTVRNEAGDPMIFRFYDPRVMNQFLPTCTTDELDTFFGNIDAFFAEDKNDHSLAAYRLEGGDLKKVVNK